MTVVSFDMAYRSFQGGSGRLDTRLDTPPSINRRHPNSCLAQGVVQIDVGEHTGDRSALRSSLLGTNNDPILHRSGLEPLTNQAQDHRISDALPDHPL